MNITISTTIRYASLKKRRRLVERTKKKSDRVHIAKWQSSRQPRKMSLTASKALLSSTKLCPSLLLANSKVKGLNSQGIPLPLSLLWVYKKFQIKKLKDKRLEVMYPQLLHRSQNMSFLEKKKQTNCKFKLKIV